MGIISAVALTGVALHLSGWLADRLPAMLVTLLTRVMGLLLAAVSVQLIFDGTRNWWG